MNWTDPQATTPQKVSISSAPRVSPVGTTNELSRRPSCHVTGSVHWGLVFGPVGPLFGAACRSPQRPSKPIQASGSLGSSTASGSTTTSGSTLVEGSSVSSQPNPSDPLRPMYSGGGEVAGVGSLR